MEIRLAQVNEFEAIMAFYHQMTEDLEDASEGPGWEKDVYPSPESVQTAIIAQNLYVSTAGNDLIAAMILNHEYTDGYEQGNWQIEAQPEELLFVHALGVSFDHQGKGLAKQLVDYMIEYAKLLNLKAIRLDVLWNNESAKQLYLTKGFKHIGTIELFYEDTGLTNYDLYEYLLVV